MKADKDPLFKYFRDIKKIKPLTKEEETGLFIEYRATRCEAIKQRLVTANLRLVAFIAKFYSYNPNIPFLDLIQEGNIGLIKAVEKFEPEKGIRFSYYASFWIKAKILAYCIYNTSLVKIGTTNKQRKVFFHQTKARRELARRGLEDSRENMASVMDVEESDIAEMEIRMNTDISLNGIAAESDTELVEILSEDRIALDELLCEYETRQIVQKIVNDFKVKQGERSIKVEIIESRIMAEEAVTLQCIGDKYGLTRERVRQIQKDLTNQLKKKLAPLKYI